MSLTQTFTDKSIAGPSGPILTWHWDFGDPASGGSNTSALENPSHTFSGDGTYTVTLTIHGTGIDDTAPGASTVKAKDVTVAAGGGGGGGGTGSILEQLLAEANADSDYDRATWSPTRRVPFWDKTTLDAAIADMHAGDLIIYDPAHFSKPVQPLVIGSVAGNGYTLSGKTMSSRVVIDFGTYSDLWDPSNESNAYVKFTTTASQANAFLFMNCTHVEIYGGYYYSKFGGGFRYRGNLTSCKTLALYIDHSGLSGTMVQPTDSHTGASTTMDTLVVRAHIYRPCMWPAGDTSHADKGTGIHGAIHHGNSGTLKNSKFAYVVTDPLKPGETGVDGVVYPEGSCGCICEIGTDNTGTFANQDNNSYILYGENLLMKVSVTPQNPGSTARQTGGNGAQFWGTVKCNGNEIKIGMVNCTGSPIHGTNEGWWKNLTSPITVPLGRHNNTLQEANLAGHTAPNNVNYPTAFALQYGDCT